jgi:hypothetical protein
MVRTQVVINSSHFSLCAPHLPPHLSFSWMVSSSNAILSFSQATKHLEMQAHNCTCQWATSCSYQIAARRFGTNSGQFATCVPAVSAYLCLQHLSTTHVHCFRQGWNFGKVILDNSGTKFWNDNPNQGWGAEGWYPATFAIPVQVRPSLFEFMLDSHKFGFSGANEARLTLDLACRSLYCGVARFFACSPPTQEVFVCLTDRPVCLGRLCRLYAAICTRARSLSRSLIGV